jgi:hypothetical protein
VGALDTGIVVPFGSNDIALPVDDGVAIPIGTRGLVIVGRDAGGVARFVLTDASGALQFSEVRPTTSTVTNVAVGTVSTLLLAANPARRGAMFWNNVNQNLYLKLGLAASTSSFTVRLAGQSFYEIQFPVYVGDITAIRSAGPVGAVLVTELT